MAAGQSGTEVAEAVYHNANEDFDLYISGALGGTRTPTFRSVEIYGRVGYLPSLNAPFGQVVRRVSSGC
jgi:hypothetical protein